MQKNTPGEIIRYFGSNTNKALKFKEAMEFWGSLSYQEKWYFEHVNLQTGLLPLEAQKITSNQPIMIEKCCSVCGKISWDSRTGDYAESHQNPISDQIGDVSCNQAGTQYWQYDDGTLELRDGNGIWIKDV